MKKYIFKSMMLSVFVLGFFVSAQAQNLIRKSAEFRNFDGTESFTTAVDAPLGTGGASIYTKTISTGPGENILYITISATGDSHDGAAIRFSCNVDGVVCNPGPDGASTGATGWVTLQKTPVPTAVTNCNDGGGGAGDCHDNDITYQWCAVLPPASVAVGGPHTVNVRMASSNGSTVFIETAHFYIDATKGGSPTCTAGIP